MINDEDPAPVLPSGSRGAGTAGWLVYGLLVPVHILLLGWLACCMSPTSDEIAHLAAGVRIWSTGRFDLYPVNPPLVKVVATLPVVLDPPRTDWTRLETAVGSRPEWRVGQDYLYGNSPRFRWDFVISRWACIPFSLIGLVYCFRWSASLFGPLAGVMAATLWCFSPNILGNGALMTPDVSAAALGLAAMFHVRTWLQSGRWIDAGLAGFMLGLAQLTKMSWLILYPLLPVLLGLTRILAKPYSETDVDLNVKESVTTRRRGGWMSFVQLICVIIISLDVLNLGYWFENTLKPLQEFQFVSSSLKGDAQAAITKIESLSESTAVTTGNRFKETWLGRVPVPLPEAYVTGLDLQRRDFEGTWQPLPSYLRGELRMGGWWYYYLYGLLVKVPAGTWLIAGCCLLGMMWNLFRKPPLTATKSSNDRESGAGVDWGEWLMLLLPMLTLFVVVSSQTGFSRYFRYVLPCFPFAFVALSSVWSATSIRLRPHVAQLAGIGLVCMGFESLAVYPHSLAFFNFPSGGPQQGHWHLLDSNFDWGQDLYHLKRWMEEHPEATPLYLAYSGVADPKLFRIEAETLPERLADSYSHLPAGWYAMSANHLHSYDAAPTWCREFLHQTPVARAGYSILIFHRQPEE